MRAREFLVEASEYEDEISSALTDLLVSAKANGVSVVSTDKVVHELNSLGFNVDIDSIMSIIQGNPLVQIASKSDITLKGTDDAAVSGDKSAAETNREKVQALAQKAAAKDL